jgi:hypothetical protein
MFMTLFVRSIGGSATGSIVAGTIFAFCGFITEWQGQASGDAAIWLPLICYGVHRLHHRGSSIVITASGFAMPVLAGHPETGAHCMFTGSAMALMLWFWPTNAGVPALDRRFAVRFMSAGILALGSASVQMIPRLLYRGCSGPCA